MNSRVSGAEAAVKLSVDEKKIIHFRDENAAGLVWTENRFVRFEIYPD